MKALLVPALLCSIMVAEIRASKQEVPIENHLPNVSGDWIRNDDGINGDHSWASFDNKDNPGDILSFSMTKVPPSINVSSSPVNQASIETFRADGYSVFSSRKPRVSRPIGEVVRHRIVSVRIDSAEFEDEIQMIEFTYVYDRIGESAGTIAHGYCVVVERNAFFVQHTSPRIIKSEIAFDMVVGMLTKHLKKPSGYGKGKILKSNG